MESDVAHFVKVVGQTPITLKLTQQNPQKDPVTINFLYQLHCKKSFLHIPYLESPQDTNK